MRPEQDRVPPYVSGAGPTTSIMGGLVFQELTRPYLASWGDWTRRAPPRLLVAIDRDADQARDAPQARADSCCSRASCPTSPTSATRSCAT